MSFKPAIAEAFRGCGASVSAVKRSRPFRKLRAEVRAQAESHPAHSPLGIACRAGHFTFGSAINPHETASDHTVLERLKQDEQGRHSGFDAEERALIQMLGDQIVAAARKFSIPRKFHQWARDWKNATSAEQQMRIGIKVARYLHSKCKKSEIKSTYADMLNQPRLRVLPKEYGRFNPRKLERPNCLGKAQMLAAFFELCGAKTYSIVPLRTSSSSMHIIYDSAAKRFCDLIGPPKFGKDKATKISAKEYLQMQLHYSTARLHQQLNQPSWPHFAIAAQMCSGRWACFDPNYSTFGRIERDWEMPKIVARLDRYRSVLPGLTVLHRTRDLETLVDAACVQPIYEAVVSFNETLASRTMPWTLDEVCELYERLLLRHTRYLVRGSFKAENVRRRRRGTKAKVMPKPVCHDDRECAIAALFLEHLDIELHAGRTTAKEWPRERICEMFRSGEARQALTGDALEAAIQALAPSLITRTLEYLDNRWKSLRLSQSLHPECEFGNTNYQLALHTLSHVAIDMGLGDSLTETLMRHGYGQFFLHNSATIVARFPERWRSINEFAELAATHLEELPYKLPSSCHLLEGLLHA